MKKQIQQFITWLERAMRFKRIVLGCGMFVLVLFLVFSNAKYSYAFSANGDCSGPADCNACAADPTCSAAQNQSTTANSQSQSTVPPSGSATYNPVSSDGTHNTVTSPGNYFTSEFWVSLAASILLYVAQLGIKITLFLFTFIIQISAYNGYLDATAVNVGWVMVRDVTNMIFVVVLLLIAFGTILGLEQYEWKKMLVKFVLAAVLVNFSRLICGILIDISQLVMTTFINGIVATAGGNLINAFGLQRIVNLNSAAKPNELTSPGIFSAAVMAVIFSLATVYTIGIFVFILAKRLVTLWILIVLSPMAFVLTIVPSTEGAASSWWGELMDNLVTGPVILFFIWLSFVTVGTGQINTEISADAANQIGQQYVIREGIQIEADKFGNQQSAGVGDAMGWNQMASFIVAVGMLIAGAEVAGQIGGSSGDALSGVADFAKKVGTVASGYTVGRYLYGAVSSGAGAATGAAKSAAKFLALDVLPVRHYSTIAANYATRQWKNFNASAAATFKEKIGDVDEEEQYRDPATGAIKIRKTGRKVKGVVGWERVDDMKDKNFFARRLGKRMLEQLESKKTLEKTEHEFETRLAIMDKSVKGIPKGWFQREWDRNNDGFDRRQDAYLDALGQRSSAKTEDHKAKALVAAMNSERVQFDPEKGEWVNKGGTLGKEIATHQLNAAAHNAVLQKIQAEAKLNVVLEDQKNTGAYPTQLMSLMNQQAIAQKQKETADARFKTAVGKITNQALTGAEGEKTLAARAKAEAEAHTEHNKEAEILKAAEVAFQGTKEGKHEALTDAEIARRMKALEGKSEVLKQEAEGVAVVSQAAAVAAAQLAAIQAEGEKERVKNIEEASRGRVLGGVGQTAQERLERERILSATASEISKEQEAASKLAASQSMTKTLAAKEAAAIRTANTAAEEKILTEEAKKTAALAEAVALEKTAAAKAKSDAVGEEVKSLEAKAAENFDKTAEGQLLSLQKQAAMLEKERAEKAVKINAAIAKAAITKDKGTEKIEVEAGINAQVKALFDEDRMKDLSEPARKAVEEAARTALGEAYSSYISRHDIDARSKMVDGALTSIEETNSTSAVARLIAKETKDLESAEELDKVAAELGNNEASQEVLEQGDLEGMKSLLSEVIREKQLKTSGLRDQLLSASQRLNAATDEQTRNTIQSEILSLQAQLTLKEKEFNEETKERTTATVGANKKVFGSVSNSTLLETLNTQIQQVEHEASRARVDGFTRADGTKVGGISESDAKRKAEMQQEADRRRSVIASWQYATEKARATKARRGYSVVHNTLLSAGEQSEIYDVRDVKMLSAALTETSEEFEKKMSNVSYEQHVGNFKRTMAKAVEVRVKAEQAYAAEADATKKDAARQAVLEKYFNDDGQALNMGMFKHGVKKAWIDDIFIAQWDNENTRNILKEKFGWTSASFTDKKTNELQAIIATGFDYDFGEQHQLVGELYDLGSKFKLDKVQVLKGLQSGKFVNSEGQDVTQDFIYNNKELEPRLLDKMKSGFMLGKNDQVQTYLDKIKKNQASFQAVAGMREELTGTSHPENGNQASEVDLSALGLKQLFIPVGSREAITGMMAEEAKDEINRRAAAQIHAIAAVLTESDRTGMNTLALSKQKDKTMRSGITTPVIHSKTPPRTVGQILGLESKDNVADFQDGNGRFQVMSNNLRTGAQNKALVAYSEENLKEVFDKAEAADRARATSAGKSAQEIEEYVIKRKRGLAASLYTNLVLARKYDNNQEDFLMITAAGGNVLPNDALNNGTMNHTFVDREGNTQNVDNVDEFVKMFNDGKFDVSDVLADLHGDFVPDVQKLKLRTADTAATSAPGGGGSGGGRPGGGGNNGGGPGGGNNGGKPGGGKGGKAGRGKGKAGRGAGKSKKGSAVTIDDDDDLVARAA